MMPKGPAVAGHLKYTHKASEYLISIQSPFLLLSDYLVGTQIVISKLLLYSLLLYPLSLHSTAHPPLMLS